MKKVKINYLGTEFQINEKAYHTTDWNGNKISPKIVISHVIGASMIKQFIKKYYPTLKVWSVSESFSMGNSIDVYITTKDISKVSDEIYNKIEDFAKSLKMGYWNSMEDMYEYNKRDKKTDNGFQIDSYCKWISVMNKPKFGTIEWGIDRMKRTGETLNDLISYVDKNKQEKFRELALTL